jgi:hypothetical protein
MLCGDQVLVCTPGRCGNRGGPTPSQTDTGRPLLQRPFPPSPPKTLVTDILTELIYMIDLEYRTLMETTKKTIWFQDLLFELAILKNARVLIYCNVESCIKIRIKHLTIPLWFVYELTSNGWIKFFHIPSLTLLQRFWGKPSSFGVIISWGYSFRHIKNYM